MELRTFRHDSERGWNIETFPPMDSEQTLVLIFGASDCLDCPDAIAEVAAAYPRSHILGCSTAGEIFGREIHDNSLSIAVARFRTSTLRTVLAPVEGASGSRAAGRELGRALLGPGLRGVLVLSDGLHVNGSELVRGLNAVLPDEVVVTGGLAGDGDRFRRTWILRDGRPVEKQVSAIGFYGENLCIGHGSRGGWDIFGPEREVTRSRGNVLYELDHQPALELYKRYLGELASDLPASALRFPLALKTAAGEDKRVVRTVLAVDESEQSMTFAGDIPEGASAQLMRANFDRLIDGANDAARLSSRRSRDACGDLLAIAISCVGRRLVLGEASEEETEACLDVLPQGTRQVGFYSYGELSPFASGRCELHNQTMTLTTIGETGACET